MMNWECGGISGFLCGFFRWTWNIFGGDLEYAFNFVTWN